jgi:hypothetical protein
MVIIIIITMGLECKRDIMWGEGLIRRRRENGDVGEQDQVCYLQMYGDNIKKPTKYCL